LVLVGLGLGFVSSANAELINLVSGVGTPGGADSKVKELTGNYTGSVPFQLIGSGNYVNATVVAPYPTWATLGGAQWDSVSATGNGIPTGSNGASAIYAETFTTNSAFVIASLSGSYAVDNGIANIWLNGTLISGALPGSYDTVSTLAPINIASALLLGTNTLYIEDDNTGGPSGLIYNLNISTSTVPEPSSLAMVGIAGLMGAGFFARRKRSIA
jgi:hypothetical protein